MADLLTLRAYLQQKIAQPFSWRDNNCMSFVVEYLDLPELPVAWFLGHDTPQRCLAAYRRKAREIGYDSLSDVFDDILGRDLTLHPKPGSVVGRNVGGAFGTAFGLHWRGLHYFLTEEQGLVTFDPQHDDVYWVVA